MNFIIRKIKLTLQKKCIAFLVLILPLIAFGITQNENKIPEPVVPAYQKLKDLHLVTKLADQSQPAIAIVTPQIYSAEAEAIQKAINQIAGVKVPILNSIEMEKPLQSNLILLGNRSTNPAIGYLYDRTYSFIDLKYPGAGGFIVQSLHNPLGDGKNILFAGGSDSEGVKTATEELVKLLNSAGGSQGNISVNYLFKVKLGKDYKIPANVKEAEIWEASEKYQSTGYFGWNMISKNMALFYMTGEERFLKEFLRLSFTDENIIKEIDSTDGELIENKKDPLAGPYHYAAHMMILLWDLIEESPLLTSEQRLQVTNAFARQLKHRLVEGVYDWKVPSPTLGNRHGDWAAYSLYVLGRYFQKDYPSPVWKRCMDAADLYFSGLKYSSWIAGSNDHLFWFSSFYDPLLDYLVLTGQRDPEMMVNLRKGLNSQQVLSTGLKTDWGLNTSSLSMLNKAAYVLNEGRWLYYREGVNLRTDILRLGQSFWPDSSLPVTPPSDLTGKWNIQWMPPQMWKSRATGFPQNQSFRWGSYRSELGAGGDFILLKGYNGAGRNPYHTFDLLELRINGSTLLKGYANQVLTNADGMVEPKVAMDAALLNNGSIGQTTVAVAEVPDLPFVRWKRSLALQKNRFALVADEMSFKSDRKNIIAETSWETPQAKWDSIKKVLQIQPRETKSLYELHTSELMKVVGGKITTMQWTGDGHKGEKKIFFHLLSQNSSGDHSLACLKLTDNTAALSLPEAGVAAAGNYKSTQGDLVILSENSLYGHAIQSAGIDEPIVRISSPAELDWDFSTGKLTIENTQPITISLALESPGFMMINNKRVSGRASESLYSFDIPAGRQDYTGVMPAKAMLAKLSNQLSGLLRDAGQIRSKQITDANAPNSSVIPDFKPVMVSNIKGKLSAESKEYLNKNYGIANDKTANKAQILANVSKLDLRVISILVPSSKGDLLCMASGNEITLLTPKGKSVRNLTTPGAIRVLRWWKEPKLLLAGCADEKVIAFDENGNKKWEFTSVMDPAVFEAGKQYWFKAFYPGIHGLYSDYFDNDKSRAFVGSAGTIEILDENGQLVKRMPVFWGNPCDFLMIDAADGTRNLLAARWQSDNPNLAIVNSKKMDAERFGYMGVPEGHTQVNGWMVMNRFDNFHTDINEDGKKEIISAINGAWNRITIYNEEGKPLNNCQFGPGIIDPRANLRMMDVRDLTGDSKQEIAIGLSSGFVDVLDHQLNEIWSKHFSSPPVLLKMVKGSKSKWVCVASEDGSVFALDSKGNILSKGKVNGCPEDLRVIQTPKGEMAVITTSTGEVSGFRTDN